MLTADEKQRLFEYLGAIQVGQETIRATQEIYIRRHDKVEDDIDEIKKGIYGLCPRVDAHNLRLNAVEIKQEKISEKTTENKIGVITTAKFYGTIVAAVGIIVAFLKLFTII